MAVTFPCDATVDAPTSTNANECETTNASDDAPTFADSVEFGESDP